MRTLLLQAHGWRTIRRERWAGRRPSVTSTSSDDGLWALATRRRGSPAGGVVCTRDTPLSGFDGSNLIGLLRMARTHQGSSGWQTPSRRAERPSGAEGFSKRLGRDRPGRPPRDPDRRAQRCATPHPTLAAQIEREGHESTERNDRSPLQLLTNPLRVRPQDRLHTRFSQRGA